MKTILALQHKRLWAKIIAMVILFTLLAPLASEFYMKQTTQAYAVESFDSLARQAVRNNYALHQGGHAVDGQYGHFGAYDAYILTQAGADVSTWITSETSLKASVLTLIDETVAKEGTAGAASAKRVAQEYLAAKEWGDARATQLLTILKNRQTASGNGSFDASAFGIYSNMPAFDALSRAGMISEVVTADALGYLLLTQDPVTKAWPTQDAPNFITNDVMTTAQAVRTLKSLKPLLSEEQATTAQTAIDGARIWLQARQQPNGSFLDATGWDDPLVDTAEVILTLHCLGIEPVTWQVGGKSALDYMRNTAKNDDNTFGTGKNLGDNTWALDAYRVLGGGVAATTALGMKVTPASSEIAIGSNSQYTAQTYKMNGTQENVTATAVWTIDAPSIATIDAGGLVTGVATGNALLTADSQGVSATASITVQGGGAVILPLGTPVSVKVTGKSGEALYDLTTVYLQAGDRNTRGDLVGITPVGALNKTGLSYTYDAIDFIYSISGQGPQGMNGWMYRINGTLPGSSAINYALNAHDQVWWFYSCDEKNMANLALPPLVIPVKTGDETILEALEKGQDIEISLQNREPEILEIAPNNIKKLDDMQKGLTLTNEGIKIAFASKALYTEQLSRALEEGSGILQIGAKAVTAEEKQEILEQTKSGQSSGLFEIGGKIIDLTAQIIRENTDGSMGTERITHFNEPVSVTLDLADLNLTEEDIAKLTAVRYEKDAEGNSVAVKLGGSYDAEHKTFTFFTEKFSYYGIAKAAELVIIKMVINEMTPTINGKRHFIEIPATLTKQRTMVPLRFIAESLDAKVAWLEETRTVVIEMGGKVLCLAADKIVPGMDAPPTISRGRVLVPLRYVSEALGARVTWFPAARRIEIIK